MGSLVARARVRWDRGAAVAAVASRASSLSGKWAMSGTAETGGSTCDDIPDGAAWRHTVRIFEWREI